MDISISNGNEAFFSDLKEIGYSGVDFPMVICDNMCEVIPSKEYADSIIKKHQKLKNAGLYACQSHLTYWPDHFEPFATPEAYAKHFAPLYARQIELTSEIECGTAVVHLHRSKDADGVRRGNVALIEALLPTLERTGVVLAIENVFDLGVTDGNMTTAEDLLFYIDYFKSKNLGICLDTGHAVALNQDPVEMLKAVSEHLKAVHIHTTIPGEDLHRIPNFMGWREPLDWNEFYDVLSASGYKGTFNLELGGPKNLTHEAMVTYYKLAYQVADGIVNKQK